MESERVKNNFDSESQEAPERGVGEGVELSLVLPLPPTQPAIATGARGKMEVINGSVNGGQLMRGNASRALLHPLTTAART